MKVNAKRPAEDPPVSSGSYMIEGLPPGEYIFVAWHEQLGQQEVKLTVGAKESKQPDFAFE